MDQVLYDLGFCQFAQSYCSGSWWISWSCPPGLENQSRWRLWPLGDLGQLLQADSVFKGTSIFRCISNLKVPLTTSRCVVPYGYSAVWDPHRLIVVCGKDLVSLQLPWLQAMNHGCSACLESSIWLILSIDVMEPALRLGYELGWTEQVQEVFPYSTVVLGSWFINPLALGLC